MQNLFKQWLAKILLLVLFCCPIVVTQQIPFWTFINYKGEIHLVDTRIIRFTVKEDYYKDGLSEKLNNPPYFPTYTYMPLGYCSNGICYALLGINDDSENVNILDHYLKFEKEEFVEEVIPYLGDVREGRNGTGFDVKGQVFQNGIPVTNYIMHLRRGSASIPSYASIGDENGNYVFPDMVSENYSYSLFVDIGNIRYDTTFILDENKIINFNIKTIVNVDKPKDIPTEYNLLQNYPNPFNPTTKIEYSLPVASMVKLSVYNTLGQEVVKLVDDYQFAGKYVIDFNAANLPSGIYFYRLQSDKFTTTKKMMLIK